MKFIFSEMVIPEIYLTPHDKEDALVNARYAAVSYIPPLSLLMLLSARKESKFIRFHAKQAFVIMLVMLIAIVFPPVVSYVIWGVCWLLVVVGFFYAAQGKYVALPGVIHVLSAHFMKDNELIKRIKEARSSEENQIRKTQN